MQIVTKSVRLVETPIPYVTNGLIAMWDAEWNKRCCLHDPSYGRLTELCHTGNDLVIDPAYGELHDNFLHCTGLGIAAIGAAELPAFDRQQIEIVFRFIAPRGETNSSLADLYRGPRYDNARYRRRFSLYVRANTYLGFSSRSGTHFTPFANRVNSVSVSCAIAESKESFVEEGFATMVSANGEPPASLFQLPGCSTPAIMPTLGMSAECDIYSIRIYGRLLSIDEVNHNYTIDKARFYL